MFSARMVTRAPVRGDGATNTIPPNHPEPRHRNHSASKRGQALFDTLEDLTIIVNVGTDRETYVKLPTSESKSLDGWGPKISPTGLARQRYQRQNRKNI
ncbi:MAG: hypothetical protein CMM01_23340 [Rhodopirellula sp.]|nr:hypothetical protein [Rhodopirellula sp.]